MQTFLITWMLVTLASAVGLLAFLAVDQWQVRKLEARAQRRQQVTAQALQAA